MKNFDFNVFAEAVENAFEKAKYVNSMNNVERAILGVEIYNLAKEAKINKVSYFPFIPSLGACDDIAGQAIGVSGTTVSCMKYVLENATEDELLDWNLGKQTVSGLKKSILERLEATESVFEQQSINIPDEVETPSGEPYEPVEEPEDISIDTVELYERYSEYADKYWRDLNNAQLAFDLVKKCDNAEDEITEKMFNFLQRMVSERAVKIVNEKYDIYDFGKYTENARILSEVKIGLQNYLQENLHGMYRKRHTKNKYFLDAVFALFTAVPSGTRWQNACEGMNLESVDRKDVMVI